MKHEMFVIIMSGDQESFRGARSIETIEPEVKRLSIDFNILLEIGNKHANILQQPCYPSSARLS